MDPAGATDAMSERYRAVQWNPQKRRYDAVLAAGVALYLGVFVGLGAALNADVTLETLLIRALGSGAFLLLQAVLCIGPLARLDPRFLPFLYNRRHLGVTVFLLAAGHGLFSLVQFHALGDANPLVSVLSANPRIDSVSQFPFEILGVPALGILALMAATSHDFWLHNLSAPVWKSIHMTVYLAYALGALHVALGILQSERSPVFVALFAVGPALVGGLHLAAALREKGRDAARPSSGVWVDACAVAELREGRGCVVPVAGERVAIFRYGGRVSALSNVCPHQNGPLGEGRILDGCVTCPWHGFQYDPATGRAPAPFTEKVPTFDVQVRGERVWVHARPHPPGTPVEPARIAGDARG